jgi:hypothetical protein
MSDEEFLEGFEACTLPAGTFHHREHVKVVWLYLHRYPLLETINRFSESLKRFATANGKPNLYHETITWAYAFLINERMGRNGRAQSWEEFVARNPDLFDWKNSILKSYYNDETLRSDFARATFVFPDIARAK